MECPPLDRVLDFALSAARQAGDLTLKHFRTDVVVERVPWPIVGDRVVLGHCSATGVYSLAAWEQEALDRRAAK